MVKEFIVAALVTFPVLSSEEMLQRVTQAVHTHGVAQVDLKPMSGPHDEAAPYSYNFRHARRPQRGSIVVIG